MPVARAPFERTDHRPWPVPDRPWIMRQRWLDLLFAHWPVPVEAVRPLVPSAIEIDTFEGRTYVGVVPFRMEDVAPRGLPSVPWLSAFPELNVRLYVRRGETPGVWFLSLDAARRLAVWIARATYDLPYVWAKMSCIRRGDTVAYASRRLEGPPHELRATYGPEGPVFEAEPGSLEHFLCERYALFAEDRRGRLRRAEIHHAPWPLQRATATFERNDLAAAHGIDFDTCRPPLLHFSDGVEVAVWNPRPEVS